MLPGWDSLASTSRYSAWFTYGTFIALGLLLILEILAHVYSTHEKTLSDAAHDAATRAAEKEKTEAIVAANSAVSQAKKDLADIQSRLSDRHLTTEQRDMLIRRLKDAPKLEVEILCAITSGDNACEYGDEIQAVLVAAGWTARPVAMAAYSPVPVGIEIVQRNKGTALPAVQALVEAFGATGIETKPLFDTQAQLAENTIRVFIGKKS